MTQLPMFDFPESENKVVTGSLQPTPDNRPLPLLVAEKWEFSLTYVGADGDANHYMYAVQDWIVGLIGCSKQHASATWAQANYSSELNSSKLPYKASNGKTYQMDFVDAHGLYRIAQELRPLKSRPELAQVLSEIVNYLAKAGVIVDQLRRDETSAQTLAKIEAWRKQGKSELWIQRRLEGQEARHGITDTWQQRGIADGKDFAELTNDVNSVALGQSATEMTRKLQLKSGKLRNHLSEAELGVIKQVEAAANTLHTINDSQGKDELKDDIEATNPIADAARRVFGAALRRKRK